MQKKKKNPETCDDGVNAKAYVKSLKKKKKYRYRSSITGLYVTEKYAKRHKRTTEREMA